MGLIFSIKQPKHSPHVHRVQTDIFKRRKPDQSREETVAASDSPRAFVYEISWDPHESTSFTKRTDAELYRELHAGLGTNEANSQGYTICWGRDVN